MSIPQSGTGGPVISVVVAVRDGEATIDACIASLLAMTPPAGGVELIVVDDGSRDSTAERLARYDVTRLTGERRGVSHARNLGLARARGEFIAFTDADCEVEPDWAIEAVRGLTEPPAAAVMGFASGINANVFAQIAQRRWETFWFRAGTDGPVQHRPGVDTRCCAVRREVLERVGGFDETLPWCVDLELSARLLQAHCRIAFNPSMRVAHRNPTSLDLLLAKDTVRMDVVIALRRDPARRATLPMPDSAFHGLGELELDEPWASALRLGLRASRSVVLSCFRALIALGVGGALTLKLLNVFYGMSYDLAILDDRQRDRGAGTR